MNLPLYPRLPFEINYAHLHINRFQIVLAFPTLPPLLALKRHLAEVLRMQIYCQCALRFRVEL